MTVTTGRPKRVALNPLLSKKIIEGLFVIVEVNELSANVSLNVTEVSAIVDPGRTALTIAQEKSPTRKKLQTVLTMLPLKSSSAAPVGMFKFWKAQE